MLTDLLTAGRHAAFTAWAKMSAAAASALRITWAYTRGVITGVCMAEASRDDMDWHTGKQQGRGVEMVEVVQPCVR